MASRSQRIHDKLQAAFHPVELRVVDESARHARHTARQSLPEGETHYQITMISDAFAGVSRLARSRAVHDALAEEFASGMHALTLTLTAPEERRSA
jgi:BolA protein